jgi:hypothetical protein
MYRILFLFILIIPFLACNSENEGQSNSATSSPSDLSMERPKIASLTFQTFDSIPNEIDECACYFYLSEKDETSAKHLLVNDFASIAFMKIEGEMKKFELETFEKEMRTYRDTQGIYRLYISVEKKVELDEETSRLEGRLHLTKGSEKAITNFIGFCGC